MHPYLLVLRLAQPLPLPPPHIRRRQLLVPHQRNRRARPLNQVLRRNRRLLRQKPHNRLKPVVPKQPSVQLPADFVNPLPLKVTPPA